MKIEMKILAVLLVLGLVSTGGVAHAAATSSWKVAQEADRVIQLPGQPPVDFAMYSGYITVNETAGRAFFYYFVEAASAKPETKPLVIWLNGGPGCSSLGGGFAEELGPFFIKPGGKELTLNPHSANKAANVIFVESPAGVGFSYSNRSGDFSSGDTRTAQDNYAFVVGWLERFPQYKGRPLYLTGESYAGVYVPQLGKLVFERNKQLPRKDRINFKGFMVGNPVTDTYSDTVGQVEYFFYHAMISDESFHNIMKFCNFHPTMDMSAPISDACNTAYSTAVRDLGNIDPYAIYAPVCGQPSTLFGNFTTRFSAKLRNPINGRRMRGYDPCTINYSTIYFNRPEVQKAMHANTTGIQHPWAVCSLTVNSNYMEQALTVLPIYRELLAAGIRIWVYSGDTDGVVPITGTRRALASLKLRTVVPWYPWYHKTEVGGRLQVYAGNLTFVTIRGAGHMVPILRGPQFLQLFRSFLNGSLLPSVPY